MRHPEIKLTNGSQHVMRDSCLIAVASSKYHRWDHKIRNFPVDFITKILSQKKVSGFTAPAG